MKRYTLLVLSFIAALLLTSCASPPSYYKSQVRHDLIQENWINHVGLSPKPWLAPADRWYYTDEPRNFSDYAYGKPSADATTAMTVSTPNFTNIEVNGPYRLQIYGRQMHSSVFVLGSNAAARHVAIEVKCNGLVIHPAAECKLSSCNDKDVIIRIGLTDLNNLVANSSGLIEGKDIMSSGLTIKSTGPNDILLTGVMNVQKITQVGSGTISVIGAESPQLDVYDTGNGTVNVSGRIGIRHLLKKGNGRVNIIGADTDELKIVSSGSGMVMIAGYANLQKLTATQKSRVYLYWVNSNGAYVNVRDYARVGLAGNALNLDVSVNSHARFEGKYLRVGNLYVQTTNSAHANVAPQQKLFATADGNSSIFFFTAPNVVSRYMSGNGLVIPIFDNCPAPRVVLPQRAPYYKDAAAPSYFPHHKMACPTVKYRPGY